MGVKGLWSILRPGARQVPVSQLAGQRLAVDLAIWVVEVQNTQMHGVVIRPHLRNIFFRVLKLLEHNVQLIFCVEGEAPVLKEQTMRRRNEARFGSGPDSGKNKKKVTGRSRFRSVLKECCDLLDALGVPWIQSPGEAEAACAALNQIGVVDGVITEDGDAFLYGAKRVIKNFGCDAKKDLEIDVYDRDFIRDSLGLNQEKLIALGLFLGCDFFPSGVKGIGRASSLKVLSAFPPHGVFLRLKTWKTRTPCVSDDYLPKCDSGCACGAAWNALSEETLRLETQLAKKVSSVEGFPDMRVVDEFLQVDFPRRRFFDSFGESLSTRPWPCPDAHRFIIFAGAKMEWVVNYSVAKILPLVALWIRRNLATTPSLRQPDPGLTRPLRIVKRRVRQSLPVFEVEWARFRFHSDDDPVDEEERCVYHTMEPLGDFGRAFPEMTREFEDRVGAKKPVKAKKKAEAESTLEDAMRRLNLQTGDGDENPAEILVPPDEDKAIENEKKNIKSVKNYEDDDAVFEDVFPLVDVKKSRVKAKRETGFMKPRDSIGELDKDKKLKHPTPKPFYISSSSSEEEDPPVAGKRRMSFLDLKRLETSFVDEVHIKMESNRKLKDEEEEREEEEEKENSAPENDIDENINLSFNISYGNFSFQHSFTAEKTPAQLVGTGPIAASKMEPAFASRISFSSTPKLNAKPASNADLDFSLDSPLPLRERLKSRHL